MARTSTTVSTSCASCGDSIETQLNPDGTVTACFGSTMTVPDDQLVDDAPTVGHHLDKTPPADSSIVVYAECKDCCAVCSAPSASHE